MSPFFHFLPIAVRVLLTRNFEFGNYKKAVSIAKAIERVSETKILTEIKLKILSQTEEFIVKFFSRLVKSLTMFRFQNGMQ